MHRREFDPKYPHGHGFIDATSVKFAGNVSDVAAREMVKKLREQERCALVVCMSHLGYYEDGKRGDTFVAAQVDGIDFIASGHTHTFMEKPVTQTQPCGAKTLIFQVGKSGIYVGRVDFSFRSGKVAAVSARLLDSRNV